MRLVIISATLLALAACTVENRGGELKQEFHPPFTYAGWKAERRTNNAGEPVCAISSGRGGVTVYVSNGKRGRVVAVGSNRALTPGGVLRLNVNGQHFETTQEFFTAADAPRIAQAFGAGDKAYLEWTEKLGAHPSFQRHTSIVKLQGFQQQFENCK